MSATSSMAGSESVQQFIEGRLDRLPDLLGQVRVNGRGRRRGMAENGLDDPQVDLGLQQMSGETVTQRMNMRGFGHAALLEGPTKGPLQSGAGDRAALLLHAVFETLTGDRREQPEWRTMPGPELAQLVEG